MKFSTSFLFLLSLFLGNAPIRSSAVAAKAQPAVLKYFDIRGAAENCRVLLAIGEEEYEDLRFPIDPKTFKSPAFEAAKESGELSANLNRAPVLVTPNGTTLGQSKAMERYLARKFGMMGSTPEEEAVIDCLAEHCRDVKDAAARKGFSRFTRDKTDKEKAKAREEWFSEDLPTMLGKIENHVKSVSTTEGYSIGSSVSYADVMIWALLRECAASDLDDTSKAVINCNTLNGIANAVAAHPKVAKYMEDRPESMF